MPLGRLPAGMAEQFSPAETPCPRPPRQPGGCCVPSPTWCCSQPTLSYPPLSACANCSGKRPTSAVSSCHPPLANSPWQCAPKSTLKAGAECNMAKVPAAGPRAQLGSPLFCPPHLTAILELKYHRMIPSHTAAPCTLPLKPPAPAQQLPEVTCLMLPSWRRAPARTEAAAAPLVLHSQETPAQNRADRLAGQADPQHPGR